MAPAPSPLQQRSGRNLDAAQAHVGRQRTKEERSTASGLASESAVAAWEEMRIGTLSVSHRRYGGLLARFIQDGSHDIRVQQVASYPAFCHPAERVFLVWCGDSRINGSTFQLRRFWQTSAVRFRQTRGKSPHAFLDG